MRPVWSRECVSVILFLVTFSSQDLIFNILWVLCWFIASVAWAVAQNDMRNYLNSTLAYNELKNLSCVDDFSFRPGSYVQAAIGDVSHTLTNLV